MEAFPTDHGLSWADQWDYKLDDQERAEKNKKQGKPNGGSNKVKAAASSGLDKAKVVAAAGAQKVKSGTNWLKDQYHKRRAASKA